MMERIYCSCTAKFRYGVIQCSAENMDDGTAHPMRSPTSTTALSGQDFASTSTQNCSAEGEIASQEHVIHRHFKRHRKRALQF
jgi:hypothetical protein